MLIMACMLLICDMMKGVLEEGSHVVKVTSYGSDFVPHLLKSAIQYVLVPEDYAVVVSILSRYIQGSVAVRDSQWRLQKKRK